MHAENALTAQRAIKAPAGEEEPVNGKAQMELLKGRINALVRSGSDLLSTYSWMQGRFDDRPKFIGWLTEPRQLSDSIGGAWNAYSQQLDQAIGTDPSSGYVYKKAQIAHAIFEGLLTVLGE